MKKIIFIFIVLASNCFGQWDTMTVDSGKCSVFTYGTATSIEIDKLNILHIAYILAEGDSWRIMYASWDSTNSMWLKEKVAKVPFWANTYLRTELQFDSKNNAHLGVDLGIDYGGLAYISEYLYFIKDTSGWHLLYNDRASWVTTTIDTEDNIYFARNLTSVDSYDTMGGGYIWGGDVGVHAIHDGRTILARELEYGVGSHFHTTYYTPIWIRAVDTNLIHLIYWWNDIGYKYVSKINTTWRKEPIEPSHFYTMELNSENILCVAYVYDTMLTYAERVDSINWVIERIARAARMSILSLAIDSLNYPYIAYECNGIKIAFFDGTNWLTETVFTKNKFSESKVNYFSTFYLDVVVDKNRNVHLIYAKEIDTLNNVVIKYGRRKPFGMKETKTSKTYINIYPNIAYKEIKICYSIQEDESLKIEIYDIYGRKIKTLINERKSTGNYVYFLDIKNFIQGVYFCAFTTKNKKIIKKFIVIR